VANFVIIVDADAARRAGFLAAIETVLAPVAGLQTARCATGDFTAIWAAHPRSPLSHVADPSGAAVLWGDAIAKSSTHRADAAELRRGWADAYDGFHAGVVYQAGQGITLGGDVLGLFPIYYYESANVLLAGSSPELFAKHPLFEREFSPAGLVGVLLTMHLVNGQTLLRRVRRLEPGRQLTWQPGELPRERVQYRLPVGQGDFDLPLAGYVQQLDEALDEAVTRHAPAQTPHGLLLSGGLDSRMIAGFLHRQGRRDTVATTYGVRGDVDLRCATAVAQTIGFRHEVVNLPASEYPQFAAAQARWEHLSNGFNTIMAWGTAAPLGALAPRMVNGYLGDAIVGGSHIFKAYAGARNEFSFATYFAFLNQWAVRPQVLKKLLRPDVFGNLVDETIARLEADYEAAAGLPSQRAWCAQLHQRQRFHVGSMLWPMSFGAWPVQPCVDQKVLAVMAAMPAAVHDERRVQIELVSRRFPQLAALPLDRNLEQATPLQPRFRWWLGWYAYGRFVAAARHRLRPREQRFYYRTFDFNGAGWRAVRRLADENRALLRQLFHSEPLAELLPPVETNVAFADGLAGSSGPKLLVGLMLWAREHLPA